MIKYKWHFRMKKVCFISWCDIFPVSAGHHKAMYEICKYLHGLEGVQVKVLVFNRGPLRTPEKYREIADDIVVIPIPCKWGLWDILNKITIRIGLDMMQNFWWSFAMRKRVMKECEGFDKIVLNYVNWFFTLSKVLRCSKTILITHDIFFYRRTSFKGAKTWLERVLVRVNRAFELHLLKSFYRVGVFGAYEVNLLKDGGIDLDRILELGLPLETEGELNPRKKIEYDFVTVGSDIYQNVEGVRAFFTRVVPLLGERRVSIAVAGSLSNSNIWESGLVPETVRVVKLGHVDNLGNVFQKALVGIGTVPCGSGIKVKNVEMIMNGLPVVVTNSGEEGIPTLLEGCINIDRMTAEVVKSMLFNWLDNSAMAIEIGCRQGKLLRQRFCPKICLAGLRAAVIEKCIGKRCDEKSFL